MDRDLFARFMRTFLLDQPEERPSSSHTGEHGASDDEELSRAFVRWYREQGSNQQQAATTPPEAVGGRSEGDAAKKKKYTAEEYLSTDPSSEARKQFRVFLRSQHSFHIKLSVPILVGCCEERRQAGKGVGEVNPGKAEYQTAVLHTELCEAILFHCL